MSYHFLFYFYLLLIMIHMCLIMILYSWHCYSSCLFFSYPFRLLFLFFFVLLHPCLAYSSCPVLFLHLIAFSCDCCHRHTCCSDPMCRHCLSANPHEWNGFLHAMPFASRPRMSGSSRSAFAWALVMSCNKMPWHHHSHWGCVHHGGIGTAQETGWWMRILDLPPRVVYSYNSQQSGAKLARHSIAPFGRPYTRITYNECICI